MRLVIALALLLAPSAARAQPAAYRGAHPLDLEGHWHAVEEPHLHDTLLVGTEPFGEVDGTRVFLGDPIAFGWSEAVWTFRGAHPIPGLAAYCGVSGDHRHAFAPEGAFRRASSGAHVYTGAMRGGVTMTRPARTLPRSPIVVPPPVASPTPYWFWGCQYQLVPGVAGAWLPTPMVTGCAPRQPGTWWGAGSGASGGAPAGAPPAEGSWFDGRYGGFRSPPVRGGEPPPPPAQRD